MSKQMADRGLLAATEETALTEARLGELNALSEEIVDLFYTQAFVPGSLDTPSEVCAAFAQILRRHWELCCIVIYLRDEHERLSESAIYIDEHVDESKVRRMTKLLAAQVEHEDHEIQAWLDDDNSPVDESRANWLRSLAELGGRACVAVPIHARGRLVGVLIAATAAPDRLREALNGIRFIAAPIVIAVGNARRALDLSRQRDQIEHLVEELRQHSHALEDANRELRRIAHYRSLFLARMSHELRTPLTSMLGFTEIMLDHEQLTDTQRRYSEKIQSSGLQLQMSLNQLVDLSRLEAGKTELFLHEFSLREVLRESCAAVARLAQKQDVKVDCPPTPNLPSIVSDEGKLRQVLYNFLAHAISRSPAESSIHVSVESTPTSRFKLIIEDRGEPLEDFSRIFEPVDIIAPSENAKSMNELGLVIARRLIDVLGGSVTLESKPPQGLRVTIELPARPTERQVERREAQGES